MVLIIDNYDSFTHNLARYFEELDQQVVVVKNDAITLEEIDTMSPSHLVISPGPCTPDKSGLSLAAIEDSVGKRPILGVCLGHQAIGQVFGAKVVGASNIKHGKVSTIHRLNDSRLLRSTREQFEVTRYHSLILAQDSLSQTGLCVTSVCKEAGFDEVMSIEHESLPIFGVQFHPESLLTEFGHQILDNFVNTH